MTPTMCRMCRAALDWSIEELSEAASVETDLIHRLEDGEAMGPHINSQLIRTFEAHGVRMRHSGPDMGAVIPPKVEPSGDHSLGNPMVEHWLREGE